MYKKVLLTLPFLALNISSFFSNNSIPDSEEDNNEILEERTYNQKIFDLGNNTKQAEIHTGDIHFKDEETGVFQDIDTTLIPTPNGWKMEKASYHLSLPRLANDWFVFTNVYEDYEESVSLRPIGTNPSVGTLATPESLWSNKKLIYPDAFGQGVDLELIARNIGFDKLVVLNSKPTNLENDLEYSFEITLGGYKIQDANGNTWDEEEPLETTSWFTLENLKKTWFRDFTVWDSMGNSEKVRVRLTKEGNTYILTKILNKEFLENATYPVYTDATATYYSGAGDGYVAYDDNGGVGVSWATAHDATDGNVADYTGTQTRVVTGDTLGVNTYYIRRSFFPIDTSGLGDSDVITAATLNLYVNAVPNNGDNDGNDFLTVVQTSQASTSSLTTADYDQAGSVSNPTEGVDTGQRKDISSITNGSTVTFTLNSTGMGWIDKTGVSMFGVREGHDVLNDAYAGADNTFNQVRFATSETTGTSQDPYLSVTYTVNDGTPPSISLGTVYPDPIGDTTPKITGTATDSAGVSSVEFQVDSTSGSWTACSADDGGFGETSETFTCTTSTLSSGAHTIYVRATDSGNNTTTSGNYSTDTFTIDSTIPNYDFVFSSFLGGSAEDTIRDVAADAQGNIYITGGTASSTYPTTAGAYDETFDSGCDNCGTGGAHDIIVTKISPSGSIIWSTFVGGPNYDRAYAIEVDDTGAVYIAGRAGTSFPTTSGVIQEAFDGDNNTNSLYGQQDGFIAKLSADGSQLLWSTYFGESGRGFIRDMDIDSSGNVYVVQTDINDTTHPHVTVGAWDTTLATAYDAFVAKINSDATSVIWGTYVGGNGTVDLGTPSIRVDSQGNVYAAGGTWSTNLTTSAGAYQTSSAGGTSDIHMIKFDSTGDMVFSTYLGGSATEYGSTHNLFLDSSERPVYGGTTTSSDFPTTAGTYQTTYGGSGGSGNYTGDNFVVKLSTDGTTLLSSTFVGGSSGEGLEGISVDSDDNVYISGATYSSDFPTTSNSYQNVLNSDAEFFASKLSSDFATLMYSTFIGGNSTDFGRSSITDTNGNFYVGGQTQSSDWPTQDPIDSTYSAGYDVAIVKLATTIAPTVSSVSSSVANTGSTITWTTDKVSSSKVDYGLTASYGSSTSETNTSTRVTSHSVDLASLVPCTIYHYRVRSKDVNETETLGSDNTFTTSGCTGSASVSSSNTSDISTASQGSLSLTSGSTGITLTTPTGYYSSDLNFQIKQLDKTSVLNTTSTPTDYSAIGSYIYDLEALSNSSTQVTSFDEPITISISYSDSDITGIDESSLRIYRYSGGSWSQTTGCSVNTSSNSVSCTTTAFSVFGLFGQTQTSSGSTTTTSSSGVSTTSAPQCTTPPPTTAPWLYGAIPINSSSIKLYFTDANDPVDHYVLEFGTKPGTYSYSSANIGGKGARIYDVANLQPNTTYYFRVRGGNGCATGSWSQELSATTEPMFKINKLDTQISLPTPTTTPKEETREAQDSSEPEQEKQQEEAAQQDTPKYTLTINVIDIQQNPVQGAEVTIHSNPRTTYTNTLGQATFENVEAGQHKVFIKYKNQTGEQSINLQGDMKEIYFNVQISNTNPFTNPGVIAVIITLSLCVIILLALLVRKSKTGK